MDNISYKDENGNIIDISVIGFFRINELEKEFIMYGLVNGDLSNVLLGEVVRDDGVIKILGINEEEIDLVVAYYNEISRQIGGNEGE